MPAGETIVKVGGGFAAGFLVAQALQPAAAEAPAPTPADEFIPWAVRAPIYSGTRNGSPPITYAGVTIQPSLIDSHGDGWILPITPNFAIYMMGDGRSGGSHDPSVPFEAGYILDGTKTVLVTGVYDGVKQWGQYVTPDHIHLALAWGPEYTGGIAWSTQVLTLDFNILTNVATMVVHDLAAPATTNDIAPVAPLDGGGWITHMNVTQHGHCELYFRGGSLIYSVQPLIYNTATKHLEVLPHVIDPTDTWTMRMTDGQHVIEASDPFTDDNDNCVMLSSWDIVGGGGGSTDVGLFFIHGEYGKVPNDYVVMTVFDAEDTVRLYQKYSFRVPVGFSTNRPVPYMIGLGETTEIVIE